MRNYIINLLGVITSVLFVIGLTILLGLSVIYEIYYNISSSVLKAVALRRSLKYEK